MVTIQVIPAPKVDALTVLRKRMRQKAATFYWGSRTKKALRHVNSTGYIKVGGAGGVLLAEVHPHKPTDTFYLVEKFMGRLVAWLGDDIAAINVQFPLRREGR